MALTSGAVNRRSGRRLSLVGVLLALGLLVTATATAPRGAATGPDPAAVTGPLHLHGRWLRDAQGRTVVLHGLFGVWKVPGLWGPTDSNTDPAGFTTADAAHVAALGFDGFRLGYVWEGLEGTQGSYDAAYLDNLARVQHDLGAVGVFSVIDSHQDMYSSAFHGDGAPAWALHSDGLTLATDLGFPLNYFTPVVQRNFDNLWRNDAGVLTAYTAQLRAVAARFAGNPMVVGYDLVNEPFPGSFAGACAAKTGCPGWDAAVLRPSEEAMARSIRKVTGSQLAFYEPTFFFNSGVPSGLYRGLNAAAPDGLSFHVQCEARAYAKVTGDKAGALEMERKICPAENARTMANGIATAARLHGQPLITEIAAAYDDDTEGLECLFEQADVDRLGWTYGLSWRSGELRNLSHDKQLVLSRAYPEAVAGDPLTYGFNPRTGHFRLTYTPRADAHGPTVVYLPVADQYPNGYTVAVSGGRVTSAPGASRLTVATTAKSTRVSVSVLPKAGAAPVARSSVPACTTLAAP